MKIISPGRIYVKNTEHKGKGVFAGKNFTKGETVEICPVIIEERIYLPGILRRHSYTWGDNKEAVALGYGSLYNHDDDPNVIVEEDEENETLRYTARRTISIDEELTIHYALLNPDDPDADPDSLSEDWFERIYIDGEYDEFTSFVREDLKDGGVIFYISFPRTEIYDWIVNHCPDAISWKYPHLLISYKSSEKADELEERWWW